MSLVQIMCCLCGHQFTERDPQPIGEDGAEFFNKPAASFVCFWCVESINDDPQDPVPSRFREGRG